jgi:hypothetical protein
VILSLILPVIVIPIQWHSNLTSIEPFAKTFLLQVNQPDAIITVKSQLNPIQTYSGINVQSVLFYGFFLAYIIGLTYKVFGFARNLSAIQQFIKQNPKERENNYWIIRLKNEMPAFSFFNFIFINENYKNFANTDLQVIKNHEIVHVKQYHTLDILFFELVSIVFWFNPVMKYLRKSLQEVHEYIVDEEVAGHGEQKKAYAQLLLNLASEAKTFNLVASFTGEHIKRRILMVAKPKTMPRYKLLFIVLVPLTIFMLLSFSYIKNPNTKVESKIQNEAKPRNETKIGQISWKGNSAYSTDTLNQILGLKKGDNYSYDELNRRLMNGDVQLLYLDNGFVFYKADIIEDKKSTGIFDLTISIYEGMRGKIGVVSVKGNKSVPDGDILNKVSIKTGDLFSKTKIVSSIRAIAAMGKFDPEKINPIPIPNQEKCTKEFAVVDLVFEVSEIGKK